MGKGVFIRGTGFLADKITAIELNAQRAFGFDFRKPGYRIKWIEFAELQTHHAELRDGFPKLSVAVFFVASVECYSNMWTVC